MISQRQLFLNHVAQTSDAPLMIEAASAEGIYITDVHGKKYIDLISGIGVSNVGHRHPKVVNAIKEQTDKYLHLMVYGEYVQSPQVRLATALVDTLPDSLDSVYFLNSGSEAIEGALKLAKRATGRAKIIACHQAYHGSSHGALSLSSSSEFTQNFRPLLPAIHHIHYGDTDELQNICSNTAAVVIETVQGEAGVRTASKSYFQALRKKCNETGTLLILDEIQCGFGRTGTFWAFEQYGIVPDILVSAKGMGGGMPISCFVANKKLMQLFEHNPVLGHITTFGGHPVSCAASLAALKAIQEENLLEKVEEKANLFRSLLSHPSIKQIRNSGLMMALEFDSYDQLKPIIDRAISKGVITDWFLFNNYSMRIAPPLTISNEEIKKACDIILESI